MMKIADDEDQMTTEHKQFGQSLPCFRLVRWAFIENTLSNSKSRSRDCDIDNNEIFLTICLKALANLIAIELIMIYHTQNK